MSVYPREYTDQKGLFRSLNKFLRKKGLVTKEDPLRYGSYVRIIPGAEEIEDDESLDDFKDYYGYCAGAHRGSRGPALLVAFEDKQLTDIELPRRRWDAGPFGYFTTNNMEKIWVHLVDWQHIFEVTNEGYDYPEMLTSHSVAIQQIAKELYNEEVNRTSD